MCIYTMFTMNRENVPPNFCPYLRQMATDFRHSFTGTLRGTFTIKRLLNIPSRHNFGLFFEDSKDNYGD